MSGAPASRPSIAVVGGGIAGLAAAHRLVELSRERHLALDLKLFEKAPRLGGSISTEHTDGFVIEGGPDSFLSEKPWALQLCERLGLMPRLVGTREDMRRTYVAYGGRLHPLPDGFLLLAPTQFWPLVASSLFTWRGKLRMALDLVLPRGGGNDESLTSFVTRRLGREALERVAQPLVGGIYTADPDRLSLAATMPRFIEMEREHRSIILAMLRQRRRAAQRTAGSGARWSLFLSFDEGIQTLVDALARRLPEGAVELGRPITRLEPAGARGWRIDGRTFGAVILATPAHVSAHLLESIDAAAARELRGIPYSSSVTVTLAYPRANVGRTLDGFGFVVPLIERRPVLACTFSSLKYPGRAPDSHLLLRAFLGGATQGEICAQDDGAIEAAVRSDLRDFLGITAEPALRRIHRHPAAMPQYELGHLARLERIGQRLQEHPGLHLAGNGYRGVGIPDCVRTGEEAAAAALGVAVARTVA